jgi:hypothetical protein
VGGRLDSPRVTRVGKKPAFDINTRHFDVSQDQKIGPAQSAILKIRLTKESFMDLVGLKHV